MKSTFRDYHLLQLLGEYDRAEKKPLDLIVSEYFRAHKALGSKDRFFLAETVYGMIRWKRLLIALAEENDWPTLYAAWQCIDIEGASRDISLPPDVRFSFPPFLYDRLVQQYGVEEAEKLCRISNTPAPVTIRTNILKTSREALLQRLEERFAVHPTKHSPYGLAFEQRIPFTTLPEFKEGLFEVQDEGSQLLALLVQPEQGDRILDYCAGSGGKTLAFAPLTKGRGQIYLHDIRPWILQDAKKRLRRAGIQNAQILLPNAKEQAKLKKTMDWVLVDAPCSGTGTLRRNPDMKERLSPAMIDRLVGEQRHIFEKALSYCKVGGKIVYGTCSLLKEENEAQIEHFCKTYPVKLEKPFLRLFPEVGGMDGFFGATLCKR